MSFLCCLTMSMLGLAWSEDTRPAPKSEPTAAANCLNKPISCCFKDVSLQEACEWFEYLMCVKITIDEDAMRQAKSDDGRHTSLEVEDMPFEEALAKLLKPMGLTYGMNENGIQIMLGTVITPAPATEEDENVPYSEEEPAKEDSAPTDLYSLILLSGQEFQEAPPLSGFIPTQPCAEEQTAVNWRHEYNAAREEADAKSKYFLLLFCEENSIYCLFCEENSICSEKFLQSFDDPKVVSLVNEQFVPLRIDGSKDARLANKLGVQQYPTIILAAPDGKIIDTVIGYMDTPTLLEKLQGVIKPVAENYFVTLSDEDENFLPDTKATIEKKLSRPVSVHFEKTPLKSVCRDLQELSGINIVLDKAALDEANIGLDQPLSLSVENISMKCILNLLLKEVHLTYEIKDEVLVITTKWGGRFVQVVYPVAKYLKGSNEDKLIKLITNTIEPDSWESMGGPGKIQYFPKEKTLVVAQQTQDVHEQIQELFAALDRQRNNAANPETCTIEELKGEPKSKVCLINTPFPPSLRGLVSGPESNQRYVQVLFPVCDLVVPADAVTPVVCQMLNKSFTLTNMDGSRTTIEGDLIELITSKVDPESWESHGGAGKIQYFPLGMSLVVVNTKEVQKKVADLLDNIRKMQDKQDKEYVLEMKLMAAKGEGDPEELALPRVTMMQGRWFTMFQGKTVTLKDGSIQDLLANGPDKGQVSLTVDTQPQAKKNKQCEDDVMVGVIIRARVTTLQAKLLRLDLIIQKNELDSASRDDIIVVGNSVRSAQRIPVGEAFNHVLEESEDGSPLVWLEVRVTAVPAFTEEIFRGTDQPITPTNAKPSGVPK